MNAKVFIVLKPSYEEIVKVANGQAHAADVRDSMLLDLRVDVLVAAFKGGLQPGEIVGLYEIYDSAKQAAYSHLSREVERVRCEEILE